MDTTYIKAILDILTFYFDSVAEVDRKMVLTILEGLVKALKS